MQNRKSIVYKSAKVLVTGASGIVGSWLVGALLEQGARPVCLIRDVVPRSYLQLSGWSDRVTKVQGTLEDYWSLERMINEYDIEVVFHLGAQTIVPTANRSPLPTFEANIRGTWNLLEACRQHRNTVRAVIVASSDKAYGDQPPPYDETAPLEGRHPYDASKSCADLIAQAYATTYEMPVAIARCGNIFGGGDLNASRLIPSVIEAIQSGRAPVLRSDGTPERDYIYVEDAVDAYLLLGAHLLEGRFWGEAFNFGYERPIDVVSMVQAVAAAAGVPPPQVDVRATASGEIQRQFLRAEKAARLLDWRPEHSVDEGLRKTVAWYRRYADQVFPL